MKVNVIHEVHNMTCPKRTVILAYIALAYVLTALLYWVVTRWVGTPFSDSLTAEQRRLKACSARVRGCIFLLSAVLVATLLAVVRPLR